MRWGEPGRCVACGAHIGGLICPGCKAGLWARERVTRCPYGHAYTPENTIHNGQGRRVCRACKNERERARYWRVRDAANGG